MKLLKIVPENTNVQFTNYRFIAFVVSGLAILGSIAAFLIFDLNYGIDFRGGTLIEVKRDAGVDFGKIRSTMNRAIDGEVKVQEFGTEGNVLIIVELQAAELATPENPEGVDENEAQQRVIETVRDALAEEFGLSVVVVRQEVVGPKVSGELIQKGVLAVVLAVVLMLVYIWFRFQWQFSVGAITALVHDVILTVGFFAVTQIEFNLSIIAAILTIVGYSMNDTVVVYDRVRENLRKYKKMELPGLLNRSVNETLSRTSMTSVTTLLALGALVIFGGANIKGFTMAMIWGVVIGTNSSIFIASPALLITGVDRDFASGEDKSMEQFAS